MHFPHNRTIYKISVEHSKELNERRKVTVKIKINEYKFVHRFDKTFLRENKTMAGFNEQMFHVLLSCALDVV